MKKKLPYKMLFDPRVPEILPEALKNADENKYKILPKEYEAPGVVDIFGDYVVTFTSIGIGNIGEDVTIFVMINPELAQSYKTWFKFMWNMCEPRNLKMDK